MKLNFVRVTHLIISNLYFGLVCTVVVSFCTVVSNLRSGGVFNIIYLSFIIYQLPLTVSVDLHSHSTLPKKTLYCTLPHALLPQ